MHNAKDGTWDSIETHRNLNTKYLPTIWFYHEGKVTYCMHLCRGNLAMNILGTYLGGMRELLLMSCNATISFPPSLISLVDLTSKQVECLEGPCLDLYFFLTGGPFSTNCWGIFEKIFIYFQTIQYSPPLRTSESLLL